MNITFGMPEILVILSVITYPQSTTLAALFFIMGILGRLSAYGVENKRYEEEKEKDLAQN